ncbi:hypothetical protein ACTFIR_003811 [Dictyostelium discoideum]
MKLSQSQELTLIFASSNFTLLIPLWLFYCLTNFCQEVVNGFKIHLLPNFKPMPNPISISIPEGPKSDCITKEVQDLLLDDTIEQVLPNRYSKRVFYSNVFTVPKPGTTLHCPFLDLKSLNAYINNQSFKMEGIKNLPSIVKQGYYMVKLDIKKAYLHVLVDLRMKSMENQIKNLSLAFTRFMKEPIQRTHGDSDTENEQNDESSNNVDVPTDNQLSNSLLQTYVKVAPFGTPEGITVSSTVKNNDTDLLIVEKRINDSLKPLLLMSSMLSSDSSNVDSAIILAVNAQASLSRVRRNNIAKEIYGFEVLLPIKIKDTPKISNNTTGNSNKSKSNSGSNGRSNNFNGSPSNVASGKKILSLQTAPRIFKMLLRPA